MYYVYILESLKTQQRYAGFTQNIKQRIKEHNRRKCRHTSKFMPWKIVYVSIFAEQKKATDFEKYLKTASGKASINKRLI